VQTWPAGVQATGWQVLVLGSQLLLQQSAELVQETKSSKQPWPTTQRLVSALQLLLQHSVSSPQGVVSGLQVPADPWKAQNPSWVQTWLQHWGPLMQETLVSRQA
jgi:hypothetical protein